VRSEEKFCVCVQVLDILRQAFRDECSHCLPQLSEEEIAAAWTAREGLSIHLLEGWRGMFNQLQDGSGYLHRNQMMCTELKSEWHELAEIFWRSLDTTGDGRISCREYLLSFATTLSPQAAQEASFRALNASGTGLLSKSEVAVWMRYCLLRASQPVACMDCTAAEKAFFVRSCPEVEHFSDIMSESLPPHVREQKLNATVMALTEALFTKYKKTWVDDKMAQDEFVFVTSAELPPVSYHNLPRALSCSNVA